MLQRDAIVGHAEAIRTQTRKPSKAHTHKKRQPTNAGQPHSTRRKEATPQGSPLQFNQMHTCCDAFSSNLSILMQQLSNSHARCTANAGPFHASFAHILTPPHPNGSTFPMPGPDQHASPPIALCRDLRASTDRGSARHMQWCLRQPVMPLDPHSSIIFLHSHSNVPASRNWTGCARGQCTPQLSLIISRPFVPTGKRHSLRPHLYNHMHRRPAGSTPGLLFLLYQEIMHHHNMFGEEATPALPPQSISSSTHLADVRLTL